MCVVTIKYPQDTELLNEAREITEKVIDELHTPENVKKPRTYRKKARKQYLQISRISLIIDRMQQFYEIGQV